MPEEANLCLNCMNIPNTALSDSNKSQKKQNIMQYFLTKNKSFLNTFKTLSKKKKIKICASVICLSVLLFTLVYLLSPVEAPVVAETNTSLNSESDGSKSNSISHAEQIFNKIFKKEDSTNENTQNNSSKISKQSNDSSPSNGNNSNQNATSSDSNTNTTPSRGSGGSNSSGDSNGNNTEGSDDSSESNNTPVLDYNDWEYTISGDELEITKYTGNDKHVMVPDQIESVNVTSIEADTFLNNSTIETVTFKDSTKYHNMWINSDAFKNCSSLKKISFPNNTDLGFFSEFAVNCPKLTDIYINHWQGKFVDGAFYWRSNGKTWELINYCEGCTNETLNVPDWVSSVHLASINLSNCKYLKVINLPNGCTPPFSQNSIYKYQYLEEINIEGDDGSQYYFTYDGVLFSRSGTGNYKLNLNLYPGAKKNKSFTFPEYCRIDFKVSGINTNLETVYIPKSSDIDDSSLKKIKNYLKNLKTVYLEKGHSNISKYESYLAWDCEVVEY